MTWSIFKSTKSSNPNDWVPNYIAWCWDTDIDTNFEPNRVHFMSDGPREVFFKWNGQEASTYIRIKNGMFDIDTIDQDIMRIVRKTGYWGSYVEGFFKKDDKLYVGIGS